MPGSDASSDVEEIEELARRARGGDDVAAARMIALCFPYWLATASRLAWRDRGISGGDEPADMVQDAVAKLLLLWGEGRGPESNTRAYVATMIRHAQANVMRSPRSRGQRLDDLAESATTAPDDDLAAVELWSERETVRQAFARLAPDHRAVLVETVVNGRKPGDLVAELDRPAPAVSSLLSRAKQALRREVLVIHLEEGEEPCRGNAARLPRRVHDAPRAHASSEAGIAHVLSCEGCQRRWRRFSAIGGALALLPLLTLAHLGSGAAPAAAAVGPDEEAEESPTDRSAHRAEEAEPSASTSRETSPRTIGVGAGRNLVGSPGALALGVLLFAAGTLCLLGLVVSTLLAGRWWTHQESSRAEPGGAALLPSGLGVEAWPELSPSGSTTAITMAFTRRAGERWRIDEVRLDLPPDTRLAAAPPQFHCEREGRALFFLAYSSATQDDPVRFSFGDARPHGAVVLTLIAEVDGSRVSGVARARW